MEKNRTDPGMQRWLGPVIQFRFALKSKPITFGKVFFIFFMQRWG
jgi:hypothetical protein